MNKKVRWARRTQWRECPLMNSLLPLPLKMFDFTLILLTLSDDIMPLTISVSWFLALCFLDSFVQNRHVWWCCGVLCCHFSLCQPTKHIFLTPVIIKCICISWFWISHCTLPTRAPTFHNLRVKLWLNLVLVRVKLSFRLLSLCCSLYKIIDIATVTSTTGL